MWTCVVELISQRLNRYITNIFHNQLSHPPTSNIMELYINIGKIILISTSVITFLIVCVYLG